MKCLACKTDGMIDATATYFASIRNCYVIIKNVPCRKCPQCGEEVFSLDVLGRIDEILEGLTNPSGKVCIMEYKSAA